MQKPIAGTLLLLCIVAGSSGARADEPLAGCFGKAKAAARACRLQVAAVYHAMQYAQAKQGLAGDSCDFGPDVDDSRIADELRDDLLGVQARNPSLPPLAVIITTLSTSRDCARGIAKSYGGPSTGWLIRQCERGLKNRDEERACAAHLGATFEALNLVSGWEGARDYVCPPKSGVQGKKLLRLVIDAAIADLAIQERPAVEGVATAVTREYPCD